MSDLTQDDTTRTYSRSPEADATTAGGRAIIYHRETKHAITLNETGTLLWQKLEQPATRQELQDLLKTRWPGIGTETAKSDVQIFIQQLQQHQLIR